MGFKFLASNAVGSMNGAQQLELRAAAEGTDLNAAAAGALRAGAHAA